MGPIRNAQRGQGEKRGHQGRNWRGHSRNQNRELLGPLCTEKRLKTLISWAETPINVACQLPITTRGIGLIVSRATSELRQYLNPDESNTPRIDVPVAAIYRLSLAQLETKMYSSSPYVSSHLNLFIPQINLLFDELLSRSSYSSRLSDLTQNLSAIALVINSIGRVNFKNKTFLPFFYKDESPLNLRLHNLRAYCDKMANQETPSSKRVEGFELNSIPNAKWTLLDENNLESVVLTNADEIISSDYFESVNEEIRKDALIVQNFIGKHRLKFSEIGGNIDFKGDGDPSILVSTHIVRGQSLAINNNVVSGNATEFWAPHWIPQDSWKLGVLALTGEVLDQDNGTVRSNVEGFRCFLNWRGLADCVF